jgi:hypothetical protein
MNKNEVIKALRSKGFDVIDYLDTLIVHSAPPYTHQSPSNEISKNEILDALDHEINFQQIKQIDSFTIVIVF